MKSLGLIVGLLGLGGVAVAAASTKKSGSKTSMGSGSNKVPIGTTNNPPGKIYTGADLPPIHPPMWRGGFVKGSALQPEYISEFWHLDPIDGPGKVMLLDFLALHPDTTKPPENAGIAAERSTYIADCQSLKKWADQHAPRLSQLLALTLYELGGTPAIAPYNVSVVQYQCETIQTYGGPLPVDLRSYATAGWVLSHPGDSAALDACIRSGKYQPFPYLQASLMARAIEIRGLQEATQSQRVNPQTAPQNTSTTPPFNPYSPHKDTPQPPKMGGDENSLPPGSRTRPKAPIAVPRAPGQPRPVDPPAQPSEKPRTPQPKPQPQPAKPAKPAYGAPKKVHARVTYKEGKAYWQVKNGDGGFSQITAKLGGPEWRQLRDANPGSANKDNTIKGAPLLRIPASWGYDLPVTGQQTTPNPRNPAIPRPDVDGVPVPGVDVPATSDDSDEDEDGANSKPTKNKNGEIVIPGTNVPPGWPTGNPVHPIQDSPGAPAPKDLKPGVVWDATTNAAYYQAKDGDGGLFQITQKIGPPGANWKDLRDANQDIFASRASSDVRNDRLRLPDSWVSSSTAGLDIVDAAGLAIIGS